MKDTIADLINSNRLMEADQAIEDLNKQENIMSRAAIKQQYAIILRAGDGTEQEWAITDCYIERRFGTITREMTHVIREHDRASSFSLSSNTHSDHCPLFDVDSAEQTKNIPCLCWED